MRIYFTAILMLKLSAAYSATWSAAFGDRELRYNEKIWSVVSESHEPEDTIFGLIDKSDGTTFLIRVEAVENLDEIDDEVLESSLEEGIADERYKAEWVDTTERSISGTTFTLVEYHITNPKFGEQSLINAYARGSDEVVIIMLAWPRGLPVTDSGLPTKLEALLEGLALAANG